MRYKIIKDVEIDEMQANLISASAQCMLKLVLNRLEKDDFNDDNFDIDYDFGMFGDETLKMKQEMGYSNDKYISAAESYVSKL